MQSHLRHSASLGVTELPGGSAGASWSPKQLGISKVIGWFKESEQSGGAQPNKMDGGAAHLTIVSGTGLNKVYTLPAGWVAYDTDYCWWKTDASLSTTDGNRLIAYDFGRTLVKYDSTSPYTLREIVILAVAFTSLSPAEQNNLYIYMQLSYLWSGTVNAYGVIKGNREGYSPWTPESVFCAEAVSLFTQMPVGQSNAVKTLLNQFILDLKSYPLWSKLDYLVLSIVSNEADGVFNFIKPSKKITNVNSVSWTKGIGYQGDGATNYIDLGFNETTDAINYNPAGGNCMMGGFMASANNNKAIMGAHFDHYNLIVNAGTYIDIWEHANSDDSTITTTNYYPALKSSGRQDLLNAYERCDNSHGSYYGSGSLAYAALNNGNYAGLACRRSGDAVDYSTDVCFGWYFSKFLSQSEHTFLYSKVLALRIAINAII